MPRKISEFFESLQKVKGTNDKLRKKVEIKEEEEGDFDIKLDEIKKEIKTEENSPKNRECRIMLKNTKKVQGKVSKSTAKMTNLRNFDESNEHKCNFCGKRFSCKKNLTKHVKNLHSNEIENLLNCKFCDKNYLKESSLEQHMKTKHIEGKTDFAHFECDFDGRIFATKKMLFYHMKSHQMTVKCEICEIKIKPRSMNIHKKLVHSTGQKFQCKICSKSFKTAILFKNHEKTHNKKFECEICKRKFPLLCNLNYHKKEYHENPGSFECEICGKKFNQKGGLSNHEKTHDKNLPKPLKCQRCDYATDRKDSYKNHQNFHERQDKKFAAMKNPLKCEKCSTFCRNKRALYQHMNAVHPKTLFQCDLCGKYIKMFDNLKKHLKNHQNLQRL